MSWSRAANRSRPNAMTAVGLVTVDLKQMTLDQIVVALILGLGNRTGPAGWMTRKCWGLDLVIRAVSRFDAFTKYSFVYAGEDKIVSGINAVNRMAWRA